MNKNSDFFGYSDFYDIAQYGNENWKGNYTQKEIACNAYNYLCEFQYSQMKKFPTSTIQELLRLLDEDHTEECDHWANTIREELKLCKTNK